MMKLVNPLILITLLFTIFAVNADDKVNEVKGEAIIIVDNKTYTLPLKKCYSATKNDNGKIKETFIASTHLTRKSKEPGPQFSALGIKSEGSTKTSYRLHVDGGFSKGGKNYRGKISYESFKENKLVFKGKTDSIRKEDKKLIKELVPISITILCNK